MAIRDLLLGKDSSESARLKGLELAKVGPLSKRQCGKYEIEIFSTTAIENGVSVLARAWDSNGQIGFGNGTVDLERFNFINPPVQVPDPDGDFERVFIDPKGNKVSKKYREDPTEALFQILAHTISVLKPKPRGWIIEGKRGSTTTTVFATGDAQVRRSSVNETYTTIRNGAGTSVTDGTDDESVYTLASATTDQFARYDKLIFGWDTSAVGSDTVDSAVVSFFGAAIDVTGLGDPEIIPSEFTPTAGYSFAAADYNIAQHGAAVATGILVSNISTSGYNDFTLNAAGEAWIDGSGDTFFSLRTSWDINNSFGGTWASGADCYAVFHLSEHTGTTNDPKLVIEHSAAATTTSSTTTSSTTTSSTTTSSTTTSSTTTSSTTTSSTSSTSSSTTTTSSSSSSTTTTSSSTTSSTTSTTTSTSSTTSTTSSTTSTTSTSTTTSTTSSTTSTTSTTSSTTSTTSTTSSTTSTTSTSTSTSTSTTTSSTTSTTSTTSSTTSTTSTSSTTTSTTSTSSSSTTTAFPFVIPELEIMPIIPILSIVR